MNKLPSDFVYNKYGYQFRFVQESDAEFILKLRTNPTLSKYIHDTENNIQKQIEWTREYKKRESLGVDYYFLMSNEVENLGLVRLYNIHNNIFTVGSWIMIPDVPLKAILACTLIVREIAFETLNFEVEDDFDGVHIDNKKVLKYNLSWGMIPYKQFQDVKGEYVALKLCKQDYLKAKPKKIKLLNSL